MTVKLLKQLDFLWENIVTEIVLFLLTFICSAMRNWGGWESLFNSFFDNYIPFYVPLLILSLVFGLILNDPLRSLFHEGLTRHFNDIWCHYFRFSPFYVSSLFALILASYIRQEHTYDSIIWAYVALGIIIVSIFLYDCHVDKVKGEELRREKEDAQKRLRTISMKLKKITAKIQNIESTTMDATDLHGRTVRDAEKRKAEMQRPLMERYITIYEQDYLVEEEQYNRILSKLGEDSVESSTTIRNKYDQYKYALSMN